jgi:hypothetical protein
MDQRPWTAPGPFPSERIHAAAIYCSDGRFGEAFDDFLHNQLGLPHYDRLAVPGGAAPLAGHIAAYREEEALREQLRFLIDSHGLERIVLIAHRNCGFYLKKLHVSEEGLRSRQEADLARAAEAIHALGPHVRIDAFLAAVEQGSVTIQPVSLADPRE